ncbi:uncharacterized protein LOC143235297 isoform X2 [Tachypleus tridentatus]|uniref:uncharacterized protein LOC143235297 isoform X2 n=1 Tax=Tachypleus tridentatus TaxID=6853 RepID=UPI003FD0A4EC
MFDTLQKKVLSKGQGKGFKQLAVWGHSVSNHLYWCASTSSGNSVLVCSKWLSLSNYVVDIHDGFDGPYQSCEHEELDNKDWIVKGSRVHKQLKLVTENKMLLKDIGYMSPYEQTSCIEAYHKVVCFFVSKSTHFYPGMRQESSQQPCTTTATVVRHKEGQACFKVYFFQKEELEILLCLL